MRILICGDRNWTDRKFILDKMSNLPIDTIIIHGCCSGADTIAGEIAFRKNLQIKEFRANWAAHGRAAGPIRNKQMLDYAKPDEVWAFHDNIEQSKGTANMIKQANKAKIPVTVFSH